MSSWACTPAHRGSRAGIAELMGSGPDQAGLPQPAQGLQRLVSRWRPALHRRASARQQGGSRPNRSRHCLRRVRKHRSRWRRTAWRPRRWCLRPPRSHLRHPRPPPSAQTARPSPLEPGRQVRPPPWPRRRLRHQVPHTRWRRPLSREHRRPLRPRMRSLPPERRRPWRSFHRRRRFWRSVRRRRSIRRFRKIPALSQPTCEPRRWQGRSRSRSWAS